jgi:hypothetical protein
MTLGCILAWISGLNAKAREKLELTPKRVQPAVVRLKPAVNDFQFMRPRDWNAKFREQGFQVFFGILLAVKANAVMNRDRASPTLRGHHAIAFGFAYPGFRRSLHRGAFPWIRFPHGTTRFRPAIASSSVVYER